MRTHNTADMLEKVRSICLALPEAVEIIDGLITIRLKSMENSSWNREGPLSSGGQVKHPIRADK